jgi:integrase
VLSDAEVAARRPPAQSKKARQEQIKAFNREQLSRFLAAVQQNVPRLYPLFFFLSRTGLRLGEARGLQWGDLDLERREVRVERAISTDGQVDTPKSGHGRTVDLSLSLREVLQRHEAKLAEAWLEQKPLRDENGHEKPKGEQPRRYSPPRPGPQWITVTSRRRSRAP